MMEKHLFRYVFERNDGEEVLMYAVISVDYEKGDGFVDAAEKISKLLDKRYLGEYWILLSIEKVFGFDIIGE